MYNELVLSSVSQDIPSHIISKANGIAGECRCDLHVKTQEERKEKRFY